MLVAIALSFPAKAGIVSLLVLLAIIYALYVWVWPIIRKTGEGAVGVVGNVAGGVADGVTSLTGVDMQANAAAARLEELEGVKGITDAEVIKFIKEKLTINEVYRKLADERFDKLPPEPVL